MTLYDPENPQHLAYLARHRAAWTRDHEQALQLRFVAEGLKTPEEAEDTMRRWDAGAREISTGEANA